MLLGMAGAAWENSQDGCQEGEVVLAMGARGSAGQLCTVISRLPAPRQDQQSLTSALGLLR